MKLTILVVGKTKTAWCQAGEMEYAKRLRPFCDLEKIEVMEEKMSPTIAPVEVKQREGERLLAKIPAHFFVVALSPSGKTFSSPAFAEFLGKIRDVDGGKICFIIGGPLGLADMVLQKADLTLSFSAMTFPHDLFRILLLEQIYRGFSILNGGPYHR